jgi:hypothetical protein
MQPKDGDAVLGSQGIEGLKSRLASTNPEQRVAALSEALDYGKKGLNLVIEALKDKSEQVQQAAFQLLRQQSAPLEQALYDHIPLISSVDVDYGYLRYLLATEQWKKADDETRTLLLGIAGREGSWLRERDIQSLPDEDLLTIDRLWTRYTSGRFGFCIQYQIWKGIVQKIGHAFSVGAFSDCVGWQMERDKRASGFSIKRQDGIPYALTAPAGHLPTLFNLGGGSLETHYWEDPESNMGLGRDSSTWYEWTVGSFFGPDMVQCFLNRIQLCEKPRK